MTTTTTVTQKHELNIDIKDVFTQLQALTQQLGGNITPSAAQQLQNDDDVLFNDFITEWLNAKRVEICTNTFDKYMSLFRNHIKPVFKGKTLRAVTIQALQSFINSKRNRLSPSTIREIKSSIIRPALHEAEGRGLINKNPADFVKIPRVDQRHSRALMDDEIRKLMKVAKGHRLFIAIPLMLQTGVRRGELLALTWDDIDFDRRELRVDKNYVITTSNGCECKEPKTKSSNRLIAIPDVLVELLREHKEKYGKGKTFVLCQQKKNKRVDPSHFVRTFKGWCTKAGIKDVSPHSTRHTYCTIAQEAGIGAKTIADQLGHTDTRMLERVYCHRRTDSLQQQAADMIGQTFNTLLGFRA